MIDPLELIDPKPYTDRPATCPKCGRATNAAGLALWGTWDLTRRLLNWSDPDNTDTAADDYQRRRRALTDVTKGQKR